jgi:hypothetical protein
MAIKQPCFWHLGLRLLGLLGLVIGSAGLGLYAAVPEYNDYALLIAAAGGGAVLLALLFEVRGLVGLVLSRRGAVGASVALQLALAVALLAGANAFAFNVYQRFDLTRDHKFTIPADIRAQLARLRDETDIVVYQQYVSFGQRAENKQDKYDLAAQKKIVEKVRDLAEQFQDLGPRFRVQVLDIQDDYYPEKFDKIKKESPKLAEAIEQAPENSIFFYTRDRGQVQRLSFSDVYQLDKKASQEQNNLVLSDQGLDGFARKVFNIEERRPRVGFAVVHEYLGQEGHEEFGMPGLKQVFATRGFEGRDIILKHKWPRPEPTVLAHEENRYEILEAQRKNLERGLKRQREEQQELTKRLKEWQNVSLPELNKQFALVETVQGLVLVGWERLEQYRKQTGRLPAHRKLSEADRAEFVQQYREGLSEMDNVLSQIGQRFDKVKEEQGKLHVEDLAEQRRITDLRAKFSRLLADIDLLVLPRLTLLNVLRDERISNRVHELDIAQVEAIKDFIKAGKPVLFCLGPSSEPQETPFAEAAKTDAIEKLLADFGVQMPPQTVLYDVEAEAMADRSERVLLLGAAPEVPAVQFDWAITPGEAKKRVAALAGVQPIRTSLKLTARSFGKTLPLDLRLRHPRPVYYLRWQVPSETAAGTAVALASPWGFGAYQALAAVAGRGSEKLDEGSVFLMTDAAGWNEEKPFPGEKPPQYERPKADDPHRGTILEKRKGPFPIGIAFEAPVPVSWYGDKQPEQTPEVRLAVLGHGGVFLGKTLTPMREKLLLDVSNWLLGRDDLLARDYQTWQYPRVQLSDTAFRLWALGAVLGLPLLFILLGSAVLMVRQMR